MTVSCLWTSAELISYLSDTVKWSRKAVRIKHSPRSIFYQLTRSTEILTTPSIPWKYKLRCQLCPPLHNHDPSSDPKLPVSSPNPHTPPQTTHPPWQHDSRIKRRCHHRRHPNSTRCSGKPNIVSLTVLDPLGPKRSQNPRGRNLNSN